MDWGYEEYQCRALQARTIAMPPEGDFETESERVLIADVLERKVWFPTAGIFTLRDGDDVQYFGLTNGPLRVRLYLALAGKKTWTRAHHVSWTVTMRRAPEYPEDKMLLKRLIARYRPPYNILGRPRSITTI